MDKIYGIGMEVKAKVDGITRAAFLRLGTPDKSTETVLQVETLAQCLDITLDENQKISLASQLGNDICAKVVEMNRRHLRSRKLR